MIGEYSYHQVALKHETMVDLVNIKIHPRETHDDVVKRLIKFFKEGQHGV